MKRISMMKKILSALIVTAFLSVNLAAVEAAPSKNGKPYPYQQSQHNSRSSAQQARRGSPRPSVQQARPVSPRPSVQQARTNSPRPVLQQPKSGSAQRTTWGNRNWKPSRTEKVNHERPRPKVQEPKKKVAKPDMQSPKYQKHIKTGPRNDLHRPPVKRTYENMHKWRRAPKAPRGYWWNHRPAHRRGRYRGYYNGIYYSDVLSTLLAAEIIHSSYYTGDTAVRYYADLPDQGFIPKEAVKYKGHHYLVFSDIGNSMEDAQQFCESVGGHLATVGDDAKNERLYRLINNSGYDNEYFEKVGNSRMIPDEPVTYVKADPESNSEEDEAYYGMYYWNYRNLREDGTSDGTGGNAFVCEWDR